MGGKNRMEKRRDAINYRPAFGYLDITKCSGYAVLDGRISMRHPGSSACPALRDREVHGASHTLAIFVVACFGP
jgi:hypothetical protein